MSVRLAIDPALAPDRPRPSARIDVVARTLDCDPCTVRRLLRRGDLEGHRVGRGVRVYLDSVRRYQEVGHIGAAQSTAPKPRSAPTTEGREAKAFLRSLGLL